MLKRILPGVERFEGRTLKASTYATTHEAEVLSGCFVMVRRVAFDEVGPLDEDFFFYGEDTDWCKRFHDACWKVVYLADAQAIHFGGGVQQVAYPVKYYLTMEQADLKYWRKHHPRAVRRAYVAIKSMYHLACTAAWLPLSLVRRDEQSELERRPRHQPRLADDWSFARPLARRPAHTSLPSPWVSSHVPCRRSANPGSRG